MGTILLPTDFSACATIALDTAVCLCRRLGHRLVVVHCLSDRGDPPGADIQRQAAERLEYLKTEIQDIPVDTYLMVGRFTEELGKLADRIRPWMLVMGSHGIGGKSEYFIGSNTQRVVRLLPFPVLVVKQPEVECAFQKVVFASGFDQRERAAFRFFLEMMAPFRPEIHLVYIHTETFLAAPVSLIRQAMESFREDSDDLPCKIHIYKDLTVDAGIRNLSEEIGADLIGISNHFRKPLKRMLVGSNVEALVNHSHIPVLSVDFEQG